MGGSFIAWISSFILTYTIPTQFSFPTLGSDSQLLLSLDSGSWPLIQAVSAFLLIFLFSKKMGPKYFQSNLSVFYLLATALVMTAILAGNAFTLLLALSAFDTLLFLFGIKDSQATVQRRNKLRHLFLSVTANFVVVIVSILPGSNGAQSAEVAMNVTSFFILLAIMFRLWSVDYLRTSGDSVAVDSYFTRVMALGLTAVMFLRLSSAGLLMSQSSILSWAGGLAIGISSIPLLVAGKNQKHEGYLAAAIIGAILVLASIQSDGDSAAASSFASLIFLSGAIPPSSDSRDRWSRLTVAVLALMIIGLPGTAGGTLSALIASRIADNAFSVLWVILGLGLTILAAGMMKQTWPRDPTADVNPSSITVVTIFIFLGTSAGIGFLSGSQISLIQGVTFMVSLAITLTLYFSIRDVTFPSPKFPVAFADIYEKTYSSLQTMLGYLGQVIRASSRIFESEAGTLWVFVILQIAIVTLGISGG
jgi:hypothetical protein